MNKLRHWLPMRRSYRSLALDLKYALYQRRRTARDGCALCSYDDRQDEVKQEAEHWLIIHNQFPYSRWDWNRVNDHLMVIPKRHLVGLSEVSDKAWLEFNKLAATYDQGGYSIYLRSQKNQMKSVQHFHWHLIKID